MSSRVKHLHQEPLLVTPRRAFTTDAFMQKNLYIHTDAPHTKTFAHKILASEKPLRRAVFIDRRIYTQQVWHKATFTHRCLYAHRRFYSRTHRSFHAVKPLHGPTTTYRYFFIQAPLHTQSFTQSNLCTQMLSHAEMFDTEKQFHRAAFAHTYGSFFAHGSFYTLMPLHRAACARRNFCMRKPLHRSFLDRETIPQRSFSRQRLLHIGTFTQRIRCTERLCAGRHFCMEKPVYTKVCYTEAFSTQMRTHTHREAFAQTRSYPQAWTQRS